MSDDFDDWIIASEDKRMEQKPSLCACVLSGDKPRVSTFLALRRYHTNGNGTSSTV